MSKTSEESIDHLFLHYMVATELCNMILQLFGVVWVMPRSVKDMFGELEGAKGQLDIDTDLVKDAKLCFSTMGISYMGSKEGFLDFLTLVDEGQNSVSTPKKKMNREVKNLECSINFDARGVGSSRFRGKRLGI
jgi:hypothetical protein